MQQKLITFAVPCYNSAAYMRHCVETLLSAGEQAEIILVDDGSGMGTCGLVGQIGVYTGWVADVASGAKAGITAFDWAGLLLVSFVLPAVLCAVLGALFRKKGWIKDGDLKLD